MKQLVAVAAFALGCAVPVVVAESPPAAPCQLVGRVVGDHGGSTSTGQPLDGTRKAALRRLQNQAYAIHANVVYVTDEELLVTTDVPFGSVVRLVGDAFYCPAGR